MRIRLSRNSTFKLNQADLPRIEIFYGYYSNKVGAEKQEITITGSGYTDRLYGPDVICRDADMLNASVSLFAVFL